LSTARELAAASVASLDVDPERAVLLAIEAAERSRASTGAPVPEAEEALHRAISASRVVMTKPGLGGSVATGPGGTATLRMEHPGEVVILDAQGRISRTIEAHEGEVNDVAFTADGARLVTTGGTWKTATLSGSCTARGRHRGSRLTRTAISWPRAGRAPVASWWQTRKPGVCAGPSCASRVRRVWWRSVRTARGSPLTRPCDPGGSRPAGSFQPSLGNHGSGSRHRRFAVMESRRQIPVRIIVRVGRRNGCPVAHG
jgi:hypothetical protein